MATEILTEELLKTMATPRGGFTRAQLAVLGFSWPPPDGWKENLLGKPLAVAKIIQVRAIGQGSVTVSPTPPVKQTKRNAHSAKIFWPEQVGLLISELLKLRGYDESTYPAPSARAPALLASLSRLGVKGSPKAKDKRAAYLLLKGLNTLTDGRFPLSIDSTILEATCAGMIKELRLFKHVLRKDEVSRLALSTSKDNRYIEILKSHKYWLLKHRGRLCAACGLAWERRPTGVIQLDHVDPISRNPGRALDYQNMQLLCDHCNRGKSNLDSTGV